jgi:hypothetical protein
VTKEILLEQANKAIAANPTCNALAISLNTSEEIFNLMKDDPNYKSSETDGLFEAKLLDKLLIVAENLPDNAIVAVNIVETFDAVNEVGEGISSSMENFCLDCGVEITPENDSGWEVFKADGLTTQSVCKACEGDRNKGSNLKADSNG